MDAWWSKATGAKLQVRLRLLRPPPFLPLPSVYLSSGRSTGRNPPQPSRPRSLLTHSCRLVPLSRKKKRSSHVFDRGAQKRQPFGFEEVRDAESAASAVAAKMI